jgi:hypothetical protein
MTDSPIIQEETHSARRARIARKTLLQKWEDAQRKAYEAELVLDAARRERNRVLSDCARAGFVPSWNEKYRR